MNKQDLEANVEKTELDINDSDEEETTEKFYDAQQYEVQAEKIRPPKTKREEKKANNPYEPLYGTARIENITDIKFSLSLAEMDLLNDFSEHASPNPRKIKRFVNNFNVGRYLFPVPKGTSSEEEIIWADKMLTWIVLCEQWPVRVSWILHKLSDISQLGGRDLKERVMRMSLKEFYDEFVRWYIFDTKVNGNLLNDDFD
jgi:hypothetical protein